MLTAHQLELRKNRVTSSLIYWVVRWPHVAWRIVNGLEVFDGFNESIEIGNYFERPIGELAADRLGLRLRKAPFRVHHRHSWMGDSCDFMLRDKETGDLRAMLEAKAAGAPVAKQYGEEGTDDVPEKVLLQSHWHLIHWGEVDRCYGAAFLGGGSLRVQLHPIDRHQELHDGLMQIAQRFWTDHIKGEKEPPLDGYDSTRDYLKSLYPSGNGIIIDGDHEVLALVRRRQEAFAAREAADAIVKECTNQLMGIVGENRGVAVNGIPVVTFADIAASTYQVNKQPYRRINVREKALKELAGYG